MKIEITGQGVRVGEALRDHVTRRLDFALGRFEESIRKVAVRIEDVNGPRGGVDKECRIMVLLHGQSEVVIRHQAKDIPAAVDGAADRAGSTVARRINRHHGVQRGGPSSTA